MNRPSGPRKTASLSDSIHQQLSMYAIAATAAGVEMLALAQPSEAKIVYTPVHQVIKSRQPYSLDLNHDGMTDFTISNFKGTSQVFIDLTVKAPAGNSLLGHPSFVGTGSLWCASALTSGAVIGPGHSFNNGRSGLVVMFYSGASGRFCVSWRNVANRYLGLLLEIKGKTHYGWARLSVERIISTTDLVYAVAISGYAYETIPGKAIVARQTRGPDDEPSVPAVSLDAPNPIPDKPHPASLGMLALGARGVALWRRKETQELIGQ